MDAITPDPTTLVLPSDTTPLVFGAHQPQYTPLPTLVIPDGRVVTQWRPTPEELAALVAGHALTLVMHRFSNRCPQCAQPLPLTPVQLIAGQVIDLT